MRKGLVIPEGERCVLEVWAQQRKITREKFVRVEVLLGTCRGESIRQTARRLQISPNTVFLWRERYRREGLAGLRNRSRPGRPRQISRKKEEQVIAATLRPPQEGTHWSARRLAPKVRLSPATVHRIWQKWGLQPHRLDTFKFSLDPEFDTKLADIVGLYLDPPERALVLCVDEKSQIQALDRTQPLLPMKPGLPARRTHDYTRHGTTSLFAALEVVSGKVYGRCFPRHTHVEFLDFLASLDRQYPRRQLHLICDNYGTHKHPKVRQWLRDHPRFHFHFTPTSASWLNLVERWFSLITTQAIRRGTFNSVRSLEGAIRKFLAHWNENATPFSWTKSAAAIKHSIKTVTEIYEAGH